MANNKKSTRFNDPITSRLRETASVFDASLAKSLSLSASSLSTDIRSKRKLPADYTEPSALSADDDKGDEDNDESNCSVQANPRDEDDSSSEHNTCVSNNTASATSHLASSSVSRVRVNNNKPVLSVGGKKKKKSSAIDDDDDEYEDQLDINGDQNDDDDPFYFEELRDWSLDEKLNSTSAKYSHSFVKFLDAKPFNFKYIQENGFKSPLVFKDKSGLGMRVPSENFKVSDVKACVGSRRQIDVMDVSTQKALTMSMKDWCEYYEKPRGPTDPLLNVISLEFSHTKLENYVEAPEVARHLDWIELAWPPHLRATHTESTNALDKMKYPKVQKYVLMSVAGCYTDFHIDMGGTSVWYHILKGEKVFWLIPPTENNLRAYTKWVMSGQQASVFLADMVDECQRITLKQGWTFMLPSGWIHAVYTSRDSLVFGGNFLHSFNIDMQLRIHHIEAKTRVPQKYRYPFFTQMMWFVLERYVHCLTGVTYLDNSTESGEDCSDYNHQSRLDRKPVRTSHPVDINSDLFSSNQELAGLKLVYQFLKSLSENKRQVPAQIIQPDLLLASFESLTQQVDHCVVKAPIEAPSGIPFTQLPKEKRPSLIKKFKKNKEEETFRIVETISKWDESETAAASGGGIQESIKAEKRSSSLGDGGSTMSSSEVRKHVMRNLPRTKGSIKKRLRPVNVPRSNVERRRRVRCHHCEPCTRDDCGECKYCKDMKKFGGTGVSKQCCLSKQCLQPLLPTTTTCMYCQKLIDRFYEEEGNCMYECEICFEIYHEQCIRKKYNIYDVDPVVNEDLKNCWQCVCCVHKGYTKSSMMMAGSASQLGASQETNSSFHSSDLMNNSFGSGVSSFNQNSNSSSDFLVSPMSTQSGNGEFTTSSGGVACAQVSPLSPEIKKKRQRRTKKEILDSKSTETHPLQSTTTTSTLKEREQQRQLARAHNLTLETLTHFQKQLILREFCEIVYDGGFGKKASAVNRPLRPPPPPPSTILNDDDDQIILTDGEDDDDDQDWAIGVSISPSARTDFSEDYGNSMAANSSFSTSSRSPNKSSKRPPVVPAVVQVGKSNKKSSSLLSSAKNKNVPAADSDVIYIQDTDPIQDSPGDSEYYDDNDDDDDSEYYTDSIDHRNRSSLIGINGSVSSSISTSRATTTTTVPPTRLIPKSNNMTRAH